MKRTSDFYTISVLGRTNFLVAFNSAFFPLFTALMIHSFGKLCSKESYDVLFIFALFAFPMLTASCPVHYLTTRFSCRNVITFSRFFEICVMIAGFFCLGLVEFASAVPLLGVVFLQGVVYSMYRPALKGYTAGMILRRNLSWASAVTEGSTFAGIFLGALSALTASYLQKTYGGACWLPGFFTMLLSGYSLLLATRLDPDLALHRNMKFRQLPRQWLDTFCKQPRYKELVFTGIGESYVFAAMIFVAAMAVQYVAMDRKMIPEFGMHLYIMSSAVIGGVIGCIAGGWRSKGNVELGLVPPASFAMALLALLIGTLPWYADFYIESGLLALLLFGFGFFGGITLVPMQAYQEYFVKADLRPAFFAWFYVPFGGGLLIAIGLSFLMYFFHIQIFTMTLLLALLTFVISVITFICMPQFLLRMLMKILLFSLYRLRISGKENIPEEGPALIVSNRASFVDIFFISACTTRPVRFMMHESFFRNKIMNPLYRAAGFLEVPSGKPKRLKQLFEKTREALANGEIVCVFPEGDITRNGTMSEFKDGMAFMLPEKVEVPVIPLRIGMTWGSIFSCYYGKFRLRWPNELPHPSSVTIGKPIPRSTSAYEIRILLTELAAETELTPGPQERPFHSQFAALAKKYPFRRQLQEYSADSSKSITNLELLIGSILLSRKLRKMSGDDTRYIGILLPNTIASVLSLLGIMMSDRTPAILNYTAGPAALRSTVAKTGLKHILTSRKFVEKLKLEVMPEMVFLEELLPKAMKLRKKIFWFAAVALLYSRELMKIVAPASWCDVDRTAVVIFSSGSTGNPKGVMLSHHNINGDVSSLVNMIGWCRNDRILGNLPVFHSFGLTVCLWMPMSTGVETVLVPNPLDAGAVSNALLGRKITVMMATPAFLQTYMRRCPKEAFASLRLAVAGAEKLRSDIAERFYKMTGLMVTEGYGCTELSPVASMNLANSIMELGTMVAQQGSIGPPLTGVCAKIVDPATFELMPENTDGLLIVKGANVMQGYLNEPEKTAEVIRNGWYITGDIAHMNRNGYITITGRVSRFTKIAGEMVPHELVEREINNILRPEDRVVAVSGTTDAKRGEKLLVFYTDAELIKPAELVKQLRSAGIPNLWIPKAENFIHVEKFPLLGSGKLDLSGLSEMARKYAALNEEEAASVEKAGNA